MTYHQLAIEVALRIRPNKAKTNAIVILCNKQIEVLHDTAPAKALRAMDNLCVLLKDVCDHYPNR